MLLSPRPQPERGARAIWNSPAFGLLGLGAFLATSIVGMTIVGHWLDGRLGTVPVLTLVFLVLGLAAGFYGAYVQLREFTERTQGAPRDGAGR
ncbi:MAG: AtpZ/AtpI family protein [Dehalococcoidia bacterium]|nr:AtpZ/AtpI family protein [Dehalococcoidia bacterium]